MVGALQLYRSSIGKKVIMAVTGLAMIGFIVFHMYGNLKVFEGAAYFNAYAEGLRELGAPIFGHSHLLWVARIGLLAAVGLHVWAAWELFMQNRAGRPRRYNTHTKVQANYAALTMRWGGVVILLFIIFHLMHLTFGVPLVHSQFDRTDPYSNLVIGFQSIPAVLVYLIALVALSFHLYHGAWSMFQTLGLNNQVYTKPLRYLGLTLALIVPLGFALVPLSVIFGFVRL